MTSREFLSILEQSLQGEMPAADISSNLNYYKDYIRNQMAEKSEDEVVDALGDPRLIARTIIDTYQMNHGTQHYESGEQSASYTYTDRQNSGYSQANTEYGGNRKQPKIHSLSMPGWLGSILGLLILFLVLGIVFWVGGLVLKLFIRFVLPVILIVAGVTWIRNQLRK